MLNIICPNCFENEINLKADNVGNKINYYGNCSKCEATLNYDKDMLGKVVRNNSIDKAVNRISIK